MKKSVKILAIVLALCLAAFLGYKQFAPHEDTENNDLAVPTENIIIGAENEEENKVTPLTLNADSAVVSSVFGSSYEITDKATLNDLEDLLSPKYNAKKAPQEESYFNVCFYCGDNCVSMDIYIDEDAVFADSGDGPFLVVGTPYEISAIIK